MESIKIKLLENIDGRIKGKIFQAVEKQGNYQMVDEDQNFCPENNSFRFKNLYSNTGIEYELTFFEEDRYLIIKSECHDEEGDIESREQLRNNLVRELKKHQIKIIEEKKIGLRQLSDYLRKFKRVIKMDFDFQDYFSIGVSLIALLPVFLIDSKTGLNKETTIKTITLTAVIAFLFNIIYRWKEGRKLKSPKEYPNPDKEAARIFDELEDY